LDGVSPPVGGCDEPQVLLSSRRRADTRFIWAVNNTYATFDPGLLWRVGNGVSTRMPVVAQLHLPVQRGEAVYDLFTGQRVQADPVADLRHTQARLYAVLPRAIARLDLRASGKLQPGALLKW